MKNAVALFILRCYRAKLFSREVAVYCIRSHRAELAYRATSPRRSCL